MRNLLLIVVSVLSLNVSMGQVIPPLRYAPMYIPSSTDTSFLDGRRLRTDTAYTIEALFLKQYQGGKNNLIVGPDGHVVVEPIADELSAWQLTGTTTDAFGNYTTA